MRLRLAAILALAALLPACGGGNKLAYQSRYIPRASQMTWDEDHEQLPWQPPSLAEQHLRRDGKPAQPQYAPEPIVESGSPVHERHFEGDGDPADRLAR